MKLRAITRIRNDAMINARKALGISQRETARRAGVSHRMVHRLEKLQFPKYFREEDISAIGRVLNLYNEEIFPTEMAGWAGTTTIEQTVDVPTSRLLEYRHTQESHFLLPAPPDQLEGSEELNLIKSVIKEKLNQKQRIVINARYGLKHRLPMRLIEVAPLIKTTRERVRQIEAGAIELIKEGIAERRRAGLI